MTRLTLTTLRSAAISLDETRSELARRELHRRKKQSAADARYRARHLEERRRVERERAKGWRAANTERARARDRSEHRKMMRQARGIHIEEKRPLAEVYAALGVEPKRHVVCRCEVCR